MAHGRWTFWRKVGLALIAAGLAAAIALIQTRVWNASEKTKAILTIATAIITALAQAFGAFAERREGRRAVDLQNAGNTLRTAMYDISGKTKIPPGELGITLYGVRKDRWPTRSGWRWSRQKRLVRDFRDRSRLRRNASPIAWRPGKGVIGLCVDQGQDWFVDLDSHWLPYKHYSEDQWDALPNDIRLGMSHTEFLSSFDRHHVVVATPVFDDAGANSKVVGCVALDGPAGSYPKLSRDDVRRDLGSAAEVVQAFSKVRKS